MDAAGFDIISHIHDEIITLIGENDTGALDRMITAMVKVPWWCKGVPIGAAGYVAKYYRKD